MDKIVIHSDVNIGESAVIDPALLDPIIFTSCSQFDKFHGLDEYLHAPEPQSQLQECMELPQYPEGVALQQMEPQPPQYPEVTLHQMVDQPQQLHSQQPQQQQPQQPQQQQQQQQQRQQPQTIVVVDDDDDAFQETSSSSSAKRVKKSTRKPTTKRRNTTTTATTITKPITFTTATTTTELDGLNPMMKMMMEVRRNIQLVVGNIRADGELLDTKKRDMRRLEEEISRDEETVKRLEAALREKKRKHAESREEVGMFELQLKKNRQAMDALKAEFTV